MEWVEIRGETLELAKERALDQLGVAIEDAEFEIVQVPESRWLGLKKTEARVRARVRPTQPRAKREGRSRRGRKGDETKSRSTSSRGRSTAGGSDDTSAASAPSATNGRESTREASPERGRGGGDGARKRSRESGGSGRGGNDTSRDGAAAETPKTETAGDERERSRPKKKERAVSDQTREELVPIDEQTQMVESFLGGVLAGFGLEGTVTTEVVDGDVQADVTGSNLGLLIGPKGGTIRALQEVTRAAAQRHADGRETHRINVDVAGYRERRREALGEFARRQAEVVRAEGRRVALEPMGSADRKAVHDAVLDIDGVRSISEGDDPRRRVVLIPDD